MCPDTSRRRGEALTGIRSISWSQCLGASACGRYVWLLMLCVTLAGCASRVVPPVPTTAAHPDFLYPTVPVAMQRTFGAEHVDLGWRYLQIDDLRSADREFAAALKSHAKIYPAHAGHGYVALARKDFDRAVTAFDSALAAASTYVPALVGRGQALLALRKESEALAAFDAAVTADPSLTDVRRRAEVLRFRNLQDIIEAARAAASAGRMSEARIAYGRALAASPESAFLHRELGIVERKDGRADQALAHLRRAFDLDPMDVASLVQIGELLEGREDFAGAEAAYRQAAALDPSADLTARLAVVSKRAREARLPAEFTAALTSEQLTRGELAALIGVRLEELLRQAPERQVVITDTREHWAATWIAAVAQAGVIDPYENHTFQPRTRVRRGDLATAVSRLLAVVAANDTALRARLDQRPAIADMTQRHVQYPAAAVVVASGVMPLLDGDRFQVGRPVSGAEAVEVVERVRALAARALNAAL
ncbi:MAG TPA: tetratricopeptide repeat protein [Vicinamibacterales bacterium]|nr:tetratricopeptide repeat protein [Vicinamibacterales bacterium]